MLAAWKKWVTVVRTERTQGGDDTANQRLAAAVLLLEVARVDGEVAGEELAQLAVGLQRYWGLSDDELDTLLDEAKAESDELVSMYAPIRIINESFSQEEKLDLIESLWRVAFADDVLEASEEHVIRRLADMLYVPHKDFIARKHRASS